MTQKFFKQVIDCLIQAYKYQTKHCYSLTSYQLFIIGFPSDYTSPNIDMLLTTTKPKKSLKKIIFLQIVC